MRQTALSLTERYSIANSVWSSCAQRSVCQPPPGSRVIVRCRSGRIGSTTVNVVESSASALARMRSSGSDSKTIASPAWFHTATPCFIVGSVSRVDARLSQSNR